MRPINLGQPPRGGGAALTAWMERALRTIELASRELDLRQVAVVPMVITIGDETSAITAGAAKYTFRMPFGMVLDAPPRISLSTAQGAGTTFEVDINGALGSIFSTRLTIDNTEKTSSTASVPAALAAVPTVLAEDEEVTIDVDAIGDGTAKGLKVYFIGRRLQ